MEKERIRKICAALLVIGIVVLIGAEMGNMSLGDLAASQSSRLVVQSTLEMTEISVNSQIAGQIVELKVEEGDTVYAGQTLAVVDSQTLLTRQMQAQGAIDAINGQISSAEATRSAAQAMLEKAQNGANAEEIAQAKAAFNLTEANFKRIQELYDCGAISKKDLDAISTEYEVARQKYDLISRGARYEDLEIAAANVNAADAAISALQGQLEQTHGSLAEIQTYLDKTIIAAPSSGVITQLNADEGELISTGTPVAVVTDTDKPWVLCNVMETDLGLVKPGQQVEVSFPAYPGKMFRGQVKSVNRSADFAVKRATNANGDFDVLAYGVRIELADVDEQLYAGMTVFVDFGEKPGEADVGEK